MAPRGRPAAADRRSAVAAAACVALAAQSWRPLWNDEVLQYVFGAYSSTSVAWRVLQATLEDILTGQTATYIVLDHWLLRVFGASRFWLRLPSLLSTILLFAAALRIWRIWGLPERWRVAGVLTLYATGPVIWHAGNARPYMPFAAAVVAVLACWLEHPADRGRGGRALGWAGMLTGALFHPYFPLYAAVLWGVGLAATGEWRSARRAAAHLGVPAAVAGAVVALAGGLSTWMMHRLTRTYDPWLEIGRGRDALAAALAGLADLPSAALGPWAGGAVVALLVLAAFRSGDRAARTAAGVVAVAGVLSAVVSAVSWRASYVIFPRQWVASAVLVAVALPLLVRSAAGGLPRRAGSGVTLLFALLLAWRAGLAAAGHIRGYAHALADYRMPAVNRSLAGLEPGDRWIALANENTRRGGPVWVIFRKYYYLTGAGTEGFGE